VVENDSTCLFCNSLESATLPADCSGFATAIAGERAKGRFAEMDCVPGEVPGDYPTNHPSSLTDTSENHPDDDRKRYHV
jgi:hypothetical protein